MVKNNGVSPAGPGYSAEPEPSCTVSAVPVSIPNADDLIEHLISRTYADGIAIQRQARDCHPDTSICYTPANAVLLGNQLISCAIMLRELRGLASGTEAGTGETEGLDPKDDGPTGNAGDAQTDGQTGGSNG